MKPDFSAVLLAGGKSTRMGQAKAFLKIAGVPLWQRQLCLLEALAPKQIIIAGPRRAEWSRPAYEIVADAQPDIGPLGGLVAALRVCTTPFLLALAVDLPRMTTRYLSGLLDLCDSGRGAVPASHQLQPLAAIYPRAALPIAEEQLTGGSYSLQDLLLRCIGRDLMREVPIHQTDVDLFLNLNTPSDLRTLIESS